MTTQEILDGLQTQIIGREIERYDQLESTNDLALQRGIDGAPEGTLILAESQTAGRGRHGRRWHAPPGSSILASLILRHRLLANRIGLPNLVGAVSVAVAIQESIGLQTQIKWPNDVLIGGRKVSGVLTELEYDQHRQPFFVMGFGVNVNTSLAEFPGSLRPSVTSLCLEAGRKIPRIPLIQAILRQIEQNYLCLRHGDVVSVIAAANRLSCTIGGRVHIETPDGIFDGKAAQIDQDGALLVRDGAGRCQKFLVGKVIHATPGALKSKHLSNGNRIAR